MLAQNAGSITDMIEISYVTFSSNAHYVIPTSASSTGWVSGTSTTALNNAIDATQAAGATNWTQALTYGENLANAKKSEGDDTYIVFFSDGAPTAGGNGYNDVADDIHDDGFNLYGIFAYGDSTDQNRMHTLVSHGNYGDGRHVDDVKGVQSFAASNQAEIEAAFAAIASAIANAVNNNHMDENKLIVSEARVDMGPTMKRIMFDSRGHVGRKDKRTSHINVTVSEK